jgi:hypothetical protein
MGVPKWLPLAYMLVILLGGSVLLMIRNRFLLWLSRRPPYQDFLPPPTCHFRLAGRADDRVEGIFQSRLANDRFRRKAAKVARDLQSQETDQLPVDALDRMMKDMLREAQFCAVVPHNFPTVGGYAALSNPGSEEVILGLDPSLVWAPSLAQSGADHELVHCVQNVCHNTFVMEWRGAIPRRMQFFYEWQATWIGGRLITFLFTSVLLWPMLLYVPM